MRYSRMKFRAALIAACTILAFVGLAPAQQGNGPPGPGNNSQAGPSDSQTPHESQGGARAFLGITLSDNSQGKVWIRAVDANSAADMAGLRPNDQLVALDDQKIFTYLDVMRYVNMKGVSDDIKVYILRHGKPGMLTAALGADYADAPSDTTYSEFPGAAPQSQNAVPNGPNDVADTGPGAAWRYTQYNGQNWFYAPNNQWQRWSNNGWVAATNGFPPQAPSAALNANTRVNGNGVRAGVRAGSVIPNGR